MLEVSEEAVIQMVCIEFFMVLIWIGRSEK